MGGGGGGGGGGASGGGVLNCVVCVCVWKKM